MMMMVMMIMCICLCEQNVTGPEEDAEARVLWLHRHPVRTQSGATAGVSSLPGEFWMKSNAEFLLIF